MYDPELEQMLEDAEFEETHRCATCDQLPTGVEPLDDEFFVTLCPNGHETIWERSSSASDTFDDL